MSFVMMDLLLGLFSYEVVPKSMGVEGNPWHSSVQLQRIFQGCKLGPVKGRSEGGQLKFLKL